MPETLETVPPTLSGPAETRARAIHMQAPILRKTIKRLGAGVKFQLNKHDTKRNFEAIKHAPAQGRKRRASCPPAAEPAAQRQKIGQWPARNENLIQDDKDTREMFEGLSDMLLGRVCKAISAVEWPLALKAVALESITPTAADARDIQEYLDQLDRYTQEVQRCFCELEDQMELLQADLQRALSGGVDKIEVAKAALRRLEGTIFQLEMRGEQLKRTARELEKSIRMYSLQENMELLASASVSAAQQTVGRGRYVFDVVCQVVSLGVQVYGVWVGITGGK
ncbi:hypothetical protein LTR37_007319 [Vermiconidia calcicola]|uniref:Uncharacterized protein n=1 Tax=Vermiconidia calcicola TaxID=1690605 RepID=A0ACC3NEU7_9PEZI|nr:hypothetical protein LTR37_007319 [Vermiconidia calcicola]